VQVVAECIRIPLAEIPVNTANGQVHLAKPPGCGGIFLAVDMDVVGLKVLSGNIWQYSVPGTELIIQLFASLLVWLYSRMHRGGGFCIRAEILESISGN
jgi:hypothetical protein